MNFSFFANLHPKTFGRYFRWKPKVKGNIGGGSWYLHVDWLCFSWQVDNEW